MARPAAMTPGSVFHGRYEVVRLLSAGGMGAVYEVIHLETRRRRALKVMLPSLVDNEELRARFQLEARVTADIDTDHIVETFDAGIDPETGSPFLVMELLQGQDLGTALAKRGRLPASEVAAILLQAAKALDKTHAANIVHRDLKPENLFIATRSDDPPRLKILDFGVAKVIAQSALGPVTTKTVGTPLYMAPEQVVGDALGPFTDRYALGHIAFTLLVGAAYFSEESRRSEAVWPVLRQVVVGAQEAASARARRHGVELPEAFDAWFAEAVHKDPQRRFSSAQALAGAFAAAMGVRVEGPLPAPHAAPAAPRSDGGSSSGALADTEASNGEGREKGANRPVDTTSGVSTGSASRAGRRATPFVLGAVVLAAAATFAAWRAAKQDRAPATAVATAPPAAPPPSTSAPGSVMPVTPAPAAASESPSATAASTATASPTGSSPPEVTPSAAAPTPPPRASARAAHAPRPARPTPSRSLLGEY